MEVLSKPFINAHAHVFTHEHVPPLLAKRLLPWPFYYFLPINKLIIFLKNWVFDRNSYLNQFIEWLSKITFFINRHTKHFFLTRWLFQIVEWIINVACALFIFSFFAYQFDFYQGNRLEPIVKASLAVPLLIRIAVVVVSAIVFRSARRTSFLLAQVFIGIIKYIAGPQTIQLIKRYLSMAYYDQIDSQENIFDKLHDLYPDGSKFVILPMDMDFIEAGIPAKPYPEQLAELRQLMAKPFINSHMLPFVAADPRRIAQDPNFFSKHIQQPITQQGFKGIKLYPPLGYYPFDENLLETMLWACENQVPIITHCIKGVIFYRGDKQKEWNYHPIFQEQNLRPIELRSFKNSEFCHHFTHPLNYECLLQPELLAKVLRLYNNATLNALYGFDPAKDKLPAKNLQNLKICLAHFGGEDEWERFLTRDKGDFEVALHKPAKSYLPKDIHQFWHSVSWFSIIYNILLRFPNTYADISFTLHDERTLSLLKFLLESSPVADRILFGTDFYVVRQKKNEKVLWTDLKAFLGEQNFEKIAIANPEKFLNVTMP